MQPTISTSTTKPPQARLRRFIRQPDRLAGRQLTPKGLEAIATIERYRFIPTSLLVRLVSGGQRNTHRHLQTLFHKGLVNRFCLPKYGGPGEFIYYLDSPHSLSTLAATGLLPDLSEEARQRRETLIRYNRENDYSQLHRDPDVQGKLLYIQHELMISRFHYLLEAGARNSSGTVQLEQWKQGTELWGRVNAQAIRQDRDTGKWEEIASSETLPHRPDAFFTLRFTDRAEDKQLVSFLYEADRGTENTTRFKLKLRAHYHAIVKQQLQRKDPYNVHAIRAVLTESTNTSWAQALLDSAKHPMVSRTPSPLFWFTTSEVLTEWPDKAAPAEQPAGRRVPRYLVEPETIFKNIWANPTQSKLKTLADTD